MNGFTAAITPGISASMPVLADILVAVLLSWIDLAERRDTPGRRNAVGVGLRSINDCSDGPLARHSPGDLLLER